MDEKPRGQQKCGTSGETTTQDVNLVSIQRVVTLAARQTVFGMRSDMTYIVESLVVLTYHGPTPMFVIAVGAMIPFTSC